MNNGSLKSFFQIVSLFFTVEVRIINLSSMASSFMALPAFPGAVISILLNFYPSTTSIDGGIERWTRAISHLPLPWGVFLVWPKQ